MGGRLLLRAAIAVLLLGAQAPAFTSDLPATRLLRTLPSCSSYESPQAVTPCYLFGRKLENMDLTLGRQRNPLTLMSSMSWVSDGKKRGIFSRLLNRMSSPLRLIMVWPFRLLSHLIDMKEVDDGTVGIDADATKNEFVTSEADPTSSTTTTTTTTTTAVIGELNDVAVLSTATQESSALNKEGLHVVTGDIFTDVAIEADPTTTSQPTTKAAARTKPAGDRWAIASNGVDLSGNWQVVVSDEFKRQYDKYLERLGQPALVRTVALGIIGRTTEELSMTDGKSLLIRGHNIRGIWDRTLIASGTEIGVDNFEPLHVPIMTADSEMVEAESWWESEGTVHVSWLHGVSRYHGGGSFESRRYLDSDGETYVCESTFYFKDNSREPNKLIWRFRRF